MPPTTRKAAYTCARCLRTGTADTSRLRSTAQRRPFSNSQRRGDDGGDKDGNSAPASKSGAMSRRLEEMTEENLEGSARSARKLVQEAGFSEELKKRLEERIAAGGESVRLDSKASAVLNMPTSAGQGTRDAAMSQPWTGAESIEDASLRMLNDAHKPLRAEIRRGRSAAPRPSSISVDMRMKQALGGNKSKGERLANARDKTSIYATSQDPSLSEKEREDMRKILKERFQPGARPMPATIQGLASLANERIEDAIARGQFKNITRGKGVNKEVDYNANSPFLNTTEYFMNKMIKRQDIVPPWIEKQQELLKTAQTFRARLRNDWKRHAARMIASKGGSLSDQIRKAEAYAVAEAKLNPKLQKVETISQIDGTGKLSQLNVVKTPMGTSLPRGDLDTQITVAETVPGPAAAVAVADAAVSASIPLRNDADGGVRNPTGQSPSSSSALSSLPSSSPSDAPAPGQPEDPLPTLSPFRDPAWESIELAYHTAALKELNNLARSYNLMAPELAKKPYYSLDRELRSCFADVAPQLPGEIHERARRPEKVKIDVIGHKAGGVLERFGGEHAKVYDSKRPNYGFRQFWQELWKRDERGV